MGQDKNGVIRVGVQSMEEIRKRRRLEWYGHAKRMEDYRLPKRALEMKATNCKRPVGRPQSRWEDKLKLDLGSRGEE
jgi:hypothetical protein